MFAYVEGIFRSRLLTWRGIFLSCLLTWRQYSVHVCLRGGNIPLMFAYVEAIFRSRGALDLTWRRATRTG
eukprot:5225743-Pyramimonas_sp.AAC.1